MNIFIAQSKFTKIFLSAGLILLLYGYLCRLNGLYFFWESKSIGWALLLIGIIGFLSFRIENKTMEKKKKVLLEEIAIGFIVLLLVVQIILIAVIPFSDAYTAAKMFLLNDKNLKTELGEIKGFGLIPMGGISESTDSAGERGSATMNITIKGQSKFKDITIYVTKNQKDSNWKVIDIE